MDTSANEAKESAAEPQMTPTDRATDDISHAGSDSGTEVTGSELQQADVAAEAHARVRKTVFLSYSHADKDTEWYTDVLQYLEQLKVGDEIDFWYDDRLEPGERWQDSIEDKLRSAKAAVFLVTPTFLTSEFISSEEVPKLLERQTTDGLQIHALIAKPCDWEQHAIGNFLRSHHLIHSPDRTLEEMEGPERRRRLNDLVKKIREEIGLYIYRNTPEKRAAIIDQLDTLLNVAIKREVGSGDSSIIYRANKGQQEIAVKKMVSRPITEVGQKELRKEFEKCRTLQSPVFTRMFELDFDNGYCVTTSDWIPGPKLSKQLTGWPSNEAGKHHAITFLTKLAAALTEAHAVGLQYLNVHPDKIRLYGRNNEPRLYPIDFSNYIANSAHAHGVFAFPIDALLYLSPEDIRKPADSAHTIGQSDDSDLHQFRRSNLADQYALGMVALTILERRPPVHVKAIADVRRLMEFQKDPRSFAENGEPPLEEHAWCREMPGLARIVWRMLEPDPENRWHDMGEVHAQLRVLQLYGSDVPAHGSEAKDAYEKHLKGNDGFYVHFYDRLCASSAEIAARFDNVDMEKQRAVLDGAIERILNFRENQQEPTTLSTIAHSQSHKGLTADHYEKFGEAFMATLAEERAINRVALDAWQAILWPAIGYLKDKATKTQGADRSKVAATGKKTVRKKTASKKKGAVRKKRSKE